MPSDTEKIEYKADIFYNSSLMGKSAGPFIIWDSAAFLFNKLLGGFLSNIILQAQTISKEKVNETTEAFSEILDDINKTGLSAKTLSITTHDDAILNGVEITQQQTTSEKYIVYFQGNGILYEDTIENKYDNGILSAAQNLNCNVIAFNYRGVGNSKGKATSKDDLVTDGLAIVQYLLYEKKIKPENIVLHGYSLGGAIATLVAERLHAKKISVSVFNSRTFSTLTNLVNALFRTGNLFNHKHPEKQSGHKESFFGKLMGWALSPIVKLTLSLTNWEIDVAKAYSQLPEDKKAYVFSRSPKNLRNKNEDVRDDTTIPHFASLHEGKQVKDERKSKKNAIRNEVLDMFFKPTTLQSTLAFFSDERSKKFIDEKKKNMTLSEQENLNQLLAQEKAFSDTKLTVRQKLEDTENTENVGYMEYTFNQQKYKILNAHDIPSTLLWKKDRNEETIFQDFFNKTTSPAA